MPGAGPGRGPTACKPRARASTMRGMTKPLPDPDIVLRAPSRSTVLVALVVLVATLGLLGALQVAAAGALGAAA